MRPEIPGTISTRKALRYLIEYHLDQIRCAEHKIEGLKSALDALGPESEPAPTEEMRPPWLPKP